MLSATSHPKEIRCWLASANLLDIDEKPGAEKPFAESFKLLDRMEKELGDSVELRLARASRLARMPAEQAKDAIRKLEEKAEGFKQAEQANLLAGLADAYQRLGDKEQPRRLLGKCATLLPQDLGVRLRLFDLARAAGDDAAAQAVEAEIRAIEGDEGVLWRFAEAARLAGKALQGDSTGVARARQLLADVAKSRPNWSRASLLKAELDDMEGNRDAALEGYLRALDQGEQSVLPLSRAVQLLTARRGVDEINKAKQLLDRAQERAAVPTELNRLVLGVSLSSDDSKERKLELVNQAVAKESKDYKDQLFRGQVFWSLEKREDAGNALRRAVELNPKAPEAWIALVTFLASEPAEDKKKEAKKKAEEEIEKARLRPARGQDCPGTGGMLRSSRAEGQGRGTIYRPAQGQTR